MRSRDAVCLDVSHSKLACNHLHIPFRQFLDQILPFTAHLHLADAKDVDGEGCRSTTVRSTGCSCSSRSINTAQGVIHPEIWQGHKNGARVPGLPLNAGISSGMSNRLVTSSCFAISRCCMGVSRNGKLFHQSRRKFRSSVQTVKSRPRRIDSGETYPWGNSAGDTAASQTPACHPLSVSVSCAPIRPAWRLTTTRFWKLMMCRCP